MTLPVLPPGEVGNNQNADYNDYNAAQRRSNSATCRLTTNTADHTITVRQNVSAVCTSNRNTMPLLYVAIVQEFEAELPPFCFLSPSPPPYIPSPSSESVVSPQYARNIKALKARGSCQT